MTLNDNPRVSAEKRYTILNKRKDKLVSYRCSRISFNYSGDIVVSMGINPYIKTKKADKLIDKINKEIREIEKFLSCFR